MENCHTLWNCPISKRDSPGAVGIIWPIWCYYITNIFIFFITLHLICTSRKAHFTFIVIESSAAAVEHCFLVSSHTCNLTHLVWLNFSFLRFILALMIAFNTTDSGPHSAIAARSSIIPSGGMEMTLLYLNIFYTVPDALSSNWFFQGRNICFSYWSFYK